MAGQPLSSCPACGAGNPAGNRFCSACGNTLPAPAQSTATSGVVCGSCGASNPAVSKFCFTCGKPVGPAAQPVASAQSSAVSTERNETTGETTVSSAAAPPSNTPSVEPDAVGMSESVPVSSATASTVVLEKPTAETAAQPQAPAEQVCAGCGAAVTGETQFCRACGTPVRSAAVAPAVLSSTQVTARAPVQPFDVSREGPTRMWILVLALVAVLGVSGWYAWKYFSGPDVTVNVFVQKVHVAVGGRTTFAASVSGAKDTGVDWSIQEGAKGGQIRSLGATAGSQGGVAATYFAPSTSGTFHVIAASHANPQRKATIEVVVGTISQQQTSTAQNQSSTPPANSQIVGNWRGPTPDMTTVIGADGTIVMKSDTDPQKARHGTYKFTDKSHLQLDLGNGDVRKWEILGITGQYLRVLSQAGSDTSALVFSRM